MKISHPNYVRDQDGYPFLVVLLDGKEAWVFYEQKFLDLGIVHLMDHEGATEPIVLPADPKRGRGEITLHGFVKDERLAELVRRYCKATDDGSFRAGPVEMPPEGE